MNSGTRHCPEVNTLRKILCASVSDSMERDMETYISSPALMTKKRIMTDFL